MCRMCILCRPRAATRNNANALGSILSISHVRNNTYERNTNVSPEWITRVLWASGYNQGRLGIYKSKQVICMRLHITRTRRLHWLKYEIRIKR